MGLCFNSRVSGRLLLYVEHALRKVTFLVVGSLRDSDCVLSIQFRGFGYLACERFVSLDSLHVAPFVRYLDGSRVHVFLLVDVVVVGLYVLV